MKIPTDDIESNNDVPLQLSPSDLDSKRFKPRSLIHGSKKKPLHSQISAPPKNAVKIKAESVDTHFRASLCMTIFCFFLVGPCWALCRSSRVRKLAEEGDYEAAEKLSHRISTVLMFSLIVGIFAWLAILFCSLGLIISGAMLRARFV